MPGSLWRWGQVRSSTGAALYEVDPATKGPSATLLVSNNPDFTTLHEASLGKKACNSGLVAYDGEAGPPLELNAPHLNYAHDASTVACEHSSRPSPLHLLHPTTGPHCERKEDGVCCDPVRVASPRHHVSLLCPLRPLCLLCQLCQGGTRSCCRIWATETEAHTVWLAASSTAASSSRLNTLHPSESAGG